MITYIYRMEIGRSGNMLITEWVYARNAKEAKAYCKKLMKLQEEKYDWFHAVKVGETKNPMPNAPCLLSDFETKQISETEAKDGERYAEHRYGLSWI